MMMYPLLGMVTFGAAAAGLAFGLTMGTGLAVAAHGAMAVRARR